MPSAIQRSVWFMTALLLVFVPLQLQAQTSEDNKFPPKLFYAKPWNSLKNIPPDCAIKQIDIITFQIGTLIAVPVTGGPQVRMCGIQDLDYVPSAWWDGSGIAVYKTHGDWALIHSKKSGWYWTFLDPKELERTNPNPDFSPSHVLSEGLSSLEKLFNTKDIDRFSTNADGYRIYSQIRKIEISPGEQLRIEPNSKSKSKGYVNGEYFNILAFKDDWIQIQEALDLEMIPSADDHNDLLKVRWNPARTGWVRWRIKGPVPGSFRILLRGIEYFGVID